MYLDTYFKFENKRKCLRCSLFSGNRQVIHTFGYAKPNFGIIIYLGIVYLFLCTAFYFSLYWDQSGDGGKNGKQSIQPLKNLTASSTAWNSACSSKDSAVFNITAFWLICGTWILSISSVQKYQLSFITTTIFNLYMSDYQMTLK